MKFIFSICVALVCTLNMYAQHTFRAIIQDKETKPLPGATLSIHAIKKSVIADSSGAVVLKNIPSGTFEITISYIGNQEKKLSLNFPLAGDSIVVIEMERIEEGGRRDNSNFCKNQPLYCQYSCKGRNHFG